MADHFDSDDPFADLTAADLDSIENAAIQATQPSQPPPSRPPPARHAVAPKGQQRILNRTRAPPPSRIEESPALEDDYSQFNVDDEDLSLEQQQPDDPLPTALSQPPSSYAALLAELNVLRLETARLKSERDKFETKAYSQDGKLDHLQRTLSRTLSEHNAALQRLANANEAEKRALRNEVEERERRLARVNAELEFQKSEARQAVEWRNGVVRTSVGIGVPGVSAVVDAEGSPKKARVVKGSGVKSPESKSRIGVHAARAFGRESVQQRGKRKREDREQMQEDMLAREMSVPMQIEPSLSEVDVNRLVMEKIIQHKSMWATTDERFELLQDILGYRGSNCDETFYLLSQEFFKQEDCPISTTILREITNQAIKADNETALANIICNILSEQWKRCLQEEDYSPLQHLQPLINFLLLRNYETCKHCLTFNPSPIHLSQSTIELHASKRIYNKETSQLLYPTVTSSFEILYTIACGLDLPEDIAHFWEILSVNFTVMSLHTKQLVDTIEGMARLLETSITVDAFGPRGQFEEEDDGVQRDPMTLVLDKSTQNLIETPRAGATNEQLWKLRETIVHTLSELVAGHVRGSKILHDAGFVLPRLITLLANEIEYFYTHPLSSDSSINLSKNLVRLLHAIIMPHTPDTLSHYLSPFPGAQQAHNVAMTRLSFGGESESVFADVADLARDLLEAAVSPEEGDGIWSLFQWEGEDVRMVDDLDDLGEELVEFLD